MEKEIKILQTVCKTRWWAKGIALECIFGYFNKSDDCMFVEVILMLTTIINDTTMESHESDGTVLLG